MRATIRVLVAISCLLALIVGSAGIVATRPETAVRAAGSNSLLPGAPVAAVYQPPDDRLDVFTVDTNGVLNDVGKAHDGAWSPPVPLSGAGFARSGASVAAAYYPTYQQLEVFVVDTNGVFNVVWRTQDGAWHGPVGLTNAGLAPSGAPLAAVYQPLNEHLEVFLIDSSGRLNVIWKEHNNKWNTPVGLSDAGFAKPGAGVAGVYYPTYQQLEVFTMDTNGALNVIWKVADGTWNKRVGLSPANLAPSGAPLAAVYQPLNEHLEVFLIDGSGRLNVIWKEHNHNWNAPFPLTDNLVPAGAGLTAVYYPTNENLEVLLVDSRGVINVIWKEHDGKWNAPVGITEARYVAGAPIAAAYYPLHNHLEAFTTDSGGVLNVEWKVNNAAWVPCGFPLLGTAPPNPTPGRLSVPSVIRTERLGQLTGSTDPENLPVLNNAGSGEWRGAGVTGVDLGANTDHDGKLFVFFGDVPRDGRSDGPPQDADLVGWSDDTALQSGGFVLHPVKAGQYFDPFAVDNNIGYLPTNRTPVGAFSYAGRAYVFGLYDDPTNLDAGGHPILTTFVASKVDPSQPGTYHLEFKFSTGPFWQVSPIVVHNAEHPGLPQSQGDGLVLLGSGSPDGIRLAWMALDPSTGPVPSSLRYYTGNAGQPWTQPESDVTSAVKHEGEAKILVNLAPHYTSVSAAWLADAKQWVLLYSKAIDAPDQHQLDPAEPVVARFATDPWVWSDEVEIFNTCRDVAYGHFMHWSGVDDINRRVPPSFNDDQPGWAYGAFVLQRFTSFDSASRRLSLAYLMSTSRPYQVQVMRTQVQLPFLPASPVIAPAPGG